MNMIERVLEFLVYKGFLFSDNRKAIGKYIVPFYLVLTNNWLTTNIMFTWWKIKRNIVIFFTMPCVKYEYDKCFIFYYYIFFV